MPRKGLAFPNLIAYLDRGFEPAQGARTVFAMTSHFASAANRGGWEVETSLVNKFAEFRSRSPTLLGLIGHYLEHEFRG
jgi:hypothetical protein